MNGYNFTDRVRKVLQPRSLFPRHLQDLADPIREVVPVHLPPTSSSHRLSLQHATHIRRAHRGQLRVTGLACLECRQVRGLGEYQQLVQCVRSEVHTSELQSHSDLVCRLLLEKTKRTR